MVRLLRALALPLPLLAVLALLCACGSDKQVDTLKGAIGPGAGGPPPLLGTLQTLPIVRPDGSVIGNLSYDGGFFALSVPDPKQQGVLTDVHTGSGSLFIAMTHISGRPDTPCRFNAALLARDGGFEIGATGFRGNDLGQQLYQVNLEPGSGYVTLFCANLRDQTGTQFLIAADQPDKVRWLQVYAVLNSLQAQ